MTFQRHEENLDYLLMVLEHSARYLEKKNKLDP